MPEPPENASPQGSRVDPPGPTRSPRRPWDASLLARVAVGHALSYPIAFAWSVATLPLIVTSMNVATLAGTERAIAWRITTRALGAFAVAYVVAHAVALPWFGWPSARTRRVFTVTSSALLLGAIGTGALAWLWLLRSP